MAIDVIEAGYRALTPVFCGGAHPERPELRLSSFKGVLRWWWRALAWPRFGDLNEIQRAEEVLFGGVECGQSRVLMRLASAFEPQVEKPGSVLKRNARDVVGEGVRYLGYGVIEAFRRKATAQRPAIEAGALTRGCFVAPFDFKLELRCRDLDDGSRALLLDALRAVGLMGGIGAKSRKGYGSLALREMRSNGVACWAPPKTIDDLVAAVRALWASPSSGGTPPYTALSRETRHVFLSAAGKEGPLELLDLVGREIMRYRSWGHNGRVLEPPSEKNFKPDRDLMKLPAEKRITHPQRIAFGLPHNYGKQPDQQVGPADRGIDRRASPLVIHIHECGTTPVAVLSFLPAQFLPPPRPGQHPLIDVGGKRVPLVDDRALWQPIHDLLDRFGDESRASSRKEPFGVTRSLPEARS